MTGLEKGVKLTSHSLHKTGASALAQLCTGPKISMIMFPWGGWSKNSRSAELYVDAEYVLTGYHAQMYDFLFMPGAIGRGTGGITPGLLRVTRPATNRSRERVKKRRERANREGRVKQTDVIRTRAPRERDGEGEEERERTGRKK